MKSTHILRLSVLAVGLAFAAPALASVSPLCDGNHGKGDDKTSDKSKSDEKEKNDKKEKDTKKPTNPA